MLASRRTRRAFVENCGKTALQFGVRSTMVEYGRSACKVGRKEIGLLRMQKVSKPVDRRTNSGGELLLATAEAFAAAAEGDPEAAAKTWLSAAEMIAACNPTEPVRAMILNNAGVAHLMRGDRSSARAALHESRRSWNTAKAILADIDVPLRPGSSAFHFRLAIE